MQGHLDSLNVSVAGALLLYQVYLHQKKTGKENESATRTV